MVNLSFSTLLLALSAFSLDVTASTRVSTEQSAVHLLSQSVYFCLATNSNVLPTKWEQLAAFDFNYWNRALVEKGIGTIQETYVFTPTNLQMLPPFKGYILIARYEPIKESDILGRYVIYNNPEEDAVVGIRSDFMREDEFIKMCKKSGVVVSPPESVDISAAQGAVAELIAKEKTDLEIIRLGAPQLTRAEIWSAYRDRIKKVFIKPSENGVTQGGQIRAVPVTVAILLMCGLSVLVFRCISKGKKPSCRSSAKT